MNDHPYELGSPLTNKYITTDFSEALLEFVTPPFNIRGEELSFLDDAHHFAHLNIDDEKLWPFSIAPYTKDSDITIAKYGRSNLARFKELYRSGLAERHGKAMQTIAGVHFNYSFSDDFIDKYLEIANDQISINEIYLRTVRNIYRNNWLLLLLFGASPVVSNNLLKKSETDYVTIGKYSYFPNATSLRMSDLGYQNTVNEFDISLASIKNYTESLFAATNEVCESFIGIKKNAQISPNILQIEDEYYSAARPKSSVASNERQIKKLRNHGIQYIELRSIDINPFEPIGINSQTIKFLEAFIVFCMLSESPNINKNEFKDIKDNDLLVSKYGRLPGLKINKDGKKIDIKSYSSEVLFKMLEIAELFQTNKNEYVKVIESKIQEVKNPDLSQSSTFLDKFLSSGLSYFNFGYEIAKDNKVQYKNRESKIKENYVIIQKEAKKSISRTKSIEIKDSSSFEDFMENYFLI